MRRFVLNNVIKLRRMIYMEIIKSYKSGNLKEILPKIPRKLIPDTYSEDRRRIFYEREILKEKIKFVLGLDYKKVKDLELYEIAENIEKIANSTSTLLAENPELGVIKDVCNDCPGGKYYVTDLCKNCIAHSCMEVCPKKAITSSGNRAIIDYDKCVSCGLCSSACPYDAIIKLERPCEKSCIPKAIGKTKTSPIEVSQEKCTGCGACLVACPFGALEFPSQILQVAHKLSTGEKLLAIFAPSVVSQFGRKVSVQQFKKALKIMGFADAFEVAIGADLVAKEEAKHFIEHGGPMLTSCCPAYVNFVKNEFPNLAEYISPIESPMVMLAKKLKKDYPDHSIVFIGPCLAKKLEAFEKKIPEYVLTFEEIGAMFAALQIEPAECEQETLNEATGVAWGFATSGGVSNALKYYVREIAGNEKAESINITVANGLAECKHVLEKLSNGKLDTDIIEGMACDGGCIAGPGVLADPRIAKSLLNMFIKNGVKK
ncbi:MULTISPECIES: monomeric [FeFe] hydrogenase [unclassified Thermosipho (in: thermotogales)]|uniref:monomeric [FeFe] hydrogenase n=1 Tax=unclassified Thermosipho (in: thermotogales) TaxID=2676525 RepID=UPI0009D48FC0|nr:MULTISPECIES: monomeric [FeFe] hydrogenase [unclassified Thermosipho (in: thermotogales)]MBT1247159.1 hypothetical protein [Thermosipho sp. 1244]OOC47088.1 hypothetical protein XO09_03195 [Thermosipho sp. 1223]